MTSLKVIENPFIERYADCPLCQCPKLFADFTVDIEGMHLTWSKCSNCSLVFQNPRLKEEAIFSLYESTSYFGSDASDRLSGYAHYVRHDKMRIAQSRRRIERIRHIAGLKQGGRLLDIGSASGFFGVAAREAGYDVTCIEPDEGLSNYGREVYGLKFHTAPLEACELEPESYDVITLWGADSHFMHPVESFEKLAAALKPGGVFACTYQDFDHWIRKIFPGLKVSWNIIYNFSDKSFDMLSQRLHLQVLHRGLEWQTVTVDHLLRVLRLPLVPSLGDYAVHVPAVSFRFVVATKK